MTSFLLSLVVVLLLATSPPANAVEYSIGVLAFNGKPEAVRRWQPTADYLTRLVEGAEFRIRPLTHQEFEHAINKNELHFILTNPGHYVLLEVKFGITRIATFQAAYQSRTLRHFSSVIFTRRDSGITDLRQLRGRTLAAVSESAFGGYQLARLELGRVGVDVDDEIQIKWLGFPHSDVVSAVMQGAADAGTIRSGILERLASKGELNLDEVSVLGARKDSNFPFLHSSGLFPEWPFAKLPNTDIELSKQVAVNLLRMDPKDPAAVSSSGSGWTIPLDYAAIHEVLRELGVEPYLPLQSAFGDFLQRYRSWIGVVVLLFFVALVALLRLMQANRQLHIAQQSLRQHQAQLENTVQERTDELLQTNQTLQIEIASHVQAEQELKDGCKSLQALHDIFIRDDLDRQQKLNSIVDAVRLHLGAEYAVLSGREKAGWRATSISPLNAEFEPPLVPALAQRAIEERQIVSQENVGEWRSYICCPVFINNELCSMFEFARSTQYQDHDHGAEHSMNSELNLRILSLVAYWVGTESRLLQQARLIEDRNRGILLRFKNLSKRETQVLQLLVRGDSSKLMARELSISTKTVEMHRANLLRKTHAKSSTELVQLAVNSGIFDQTR